MNFSDGKYPSEMQVESAPTTSEADKHVDIGKASNRVWLVKLPSFLMEHWQSQPQNAPLGHVRIGKTDDKGVPPVTLHTIDHPGIPKTFNIKFTSNPPGNMLMFTENEQGKAVGIEGTIQHECTVVPNMDEDYRRIMRERREEAERPKRSVQVVEAKGKSQMLELKADRFMNFDSRKYGKKRQNGDLRRDRLPREQVINMLFEAFQMYDHWTLKGLVEKTKQPMAYLKEVLSDVCDYFQRGPYKQLYRLKPEYDISAAATAAPTALSEQNQLQSLHADGSEEFDDLEGLSE